MSEPQYVRITIRNPRGNDVGEIAEAWFTVEDGRVQLTKHDGTPMPGQDTRRRIMDGETPIMVARDLLRGVQGRRRSFNGPIDMGGWTGIV